MLAHFKFPRALINFLRWDLRFHTPSRWHDSFRRRFFGIRPDDKTDLRNPLFAGAIGESNMIDRLLSNGGPGPYASALRISHCAGRDIFKPAKIHFGMRLAHEPRFT